MGIQQAVILERIVSIRGFFWIIFVLGDPVCSKTRKDLSNKLKMKKIYA